MVRNDEATRVLESVYRSDSRILFAQLVRVLGDFDIAEDALQEAVCIAAGQWPRQGVPDNPAAWLYKVSRWRGIDALRKRRRTSPLTEHEIDNAEQFEVVGDELLRLIFTCCHPALSPDAQVALTLREVCELTTEEIASAYLTPLPTVAQRIVRAKSKIRQAQIPFEVPGKEELPERLDSVLKTIYLVFNEGYSSSSGKKVVRTELIILAIHLARQLLDLFPHPETMGLLALMMLHQARVSARTTSDGEIILLEDQDRSLWNREKIVQAGELVAQALRSRRYGVYTVQAAIAALHAEAPSYSETDWDEIVGLYDVLVRLEPSPVVELNRAVAIAMKDGLSVGIGLIDDLLAKQELENYYFAYAARAGLHRRLGNNAKARSDYLIALNLTRQEPERRLIQRGLDKII